MRRRWICLLPKDHSLGSQCLDQYLPHYVNYSHKVPLGCHLKSGYFWCPWVLARGKGECFRTLKMKAVGKVSHLSFSLPTRLSSRMLLGEVDPVFQFCHSLQELCVIEVHVGCKVCTNRWLHVPKSAVQRSSSNTKENCCYAQQDQ